MTGNPGAGYPGRKLFFREVATEAIKNLTCNGEEVYAFLRKGK